MTQQKTHQYENNYYNLTPSSKVVICYVHLNIKNKLMCIPYLFIMIQIHMAIINGSIFQLKMYRLNSHMSLKLSIL